MSFIIIVSLLSISANRHLQTSAHPTKGTLEIHLPNKKLKVELNSPSTLIEKFMNGRIKHISFTNISKYYEVSFYPKPLGINSQVALIKRFIVTDQGHLLDGLSESYNEFGDLATSTSWSHGLLQGEQQIIEGEKGRTIEKRAFDKNLPVGEWLSYFPNDKVSARIQFPASYLEWQQTEAVSPNSDGEKNLYNMTFNKPYISTAKWYYPNGKLQQEKVYKMYKEGNLIVVIPTGNAINYTPQGLPLKVTTIPHGTGISVEKYTRGGINYISTTEWFNHQFFKVVDLEFKNKSIEKP